MSNFTQRNINNVARLIPLSFFTSNIPIPVWELGLRKKACEGGSLFSMIRRVAHHITSPHLEIGLQSNESLDSVAESSGVQTKEAWEIFMISMPAQTIGQVKGFKWTASQSPWNYGRDKNLLLFTRNTTEEESICISLTASGVISTHNQTSRLYNVVSKNCTSW